MIAVEVSRHSVASQCSLILVLIVFDVTHHYTSFVSRLNDILYELFRSTYDEKYSSITRTKSYSSVFTLSIAITHWKKTLYGLVMKYVRVFQITCPVGKSETTIDTNKMKWETFSTFVFLTFAKRFTTVIFQSFHTFYFIILAIQYILIIICIYIWSQNLQKYELLFFI